MFCLKFDSIDCPLGPHAFICMAGTKGILYRVLNRRESYVEQYVHCASPSFLRLLRHANSRGGNSTTELTYQAFISQIVNTVLGCPPPPPHQPVCVPRSCDGSTLHHILFFRLKCYALCYMWLPLATSMGKTQSVCFRNADRDIICETRHRTV